MEDTQNPIKLTFGPYRVDTEYNRLFRNEKHIPLPRKRFEILLLLVQNAGRLLTKNEILQAIWPDQCIEENNLTQHVYLLRQSIEDDPRYPRYIVTIPGKGYLFQGTEPPFEPDRSVTGSELTNQPALSASDDETAINLPINISDTQVTHTESRILPKTASRLTITLLSLLILGLLAGGVWMTYSWELRGHPRNVNPISIPLQTLTGFKKDLSFSPDGKMLAFTSESETSNKTDLYIRMISGGESIRLTRTPENELDVAWSPQGDRLAFLRWPEPPDGKAAKYQMVIIPTLGGTEQIITQVESGLDWSPDGKYLAASDNQPQGKSVAILLVTPDTQERRFVSSPPAGTTVFDNLPRFDRTGQRIAFVRWESGVSGDLFLTNLQSGETKQLTFDKRTISDLHFSSDNETIIFVSNRNGNNRLWEIPVNGGTPSLVTSITEEINRLTISPVNGQIAFTQRTNDTATEITPLNRLTRATDQLRSPCFINSSRSDDTPRFSPDAGRIAFISNRTGKDEIWIAQADCSQPRQLTNLAENGVGSPRWSPDGHYIIFDHHIGGQSEISMVEINSGIVTRLTNDPLPNFLPSWSKDGKSFYYCSTKSGREEIWKKFLDRDNPVQITNQGGFEAVESPDGRLLYFTNRDQLWTYDTDSGNVRLINELSAYRIKRYWHVAAGAIYFVPYQRMEILRFDLTTRTIQNPTNLPGFATTNVPGLSLNPGETLLATSYINYRFGDIILTTNWK
jgi:Tol biopolymer transport system component/DNA-binding winged helix-turn-helix (wHTH) protein